MDFYNIDHSYDIYRWENQCIKHKTVVMYIYIYMNLIL